MEETISNSTAKKIAVVTGANKGIGLEICRQLACRGVTVVLTARDVERGVKAVEKLKESGGVDVVFHQLDVADPASVASLAGFIKTKFGRLDILVNNAAVGGLAIDPQALDSFVKDNFEQQGGMVSFTRALATAKQNYEKAEECLNINFYGPKRVIEALISLLQLSYSPRIVNVSSTYGKLQFIPSKIIRKELGEMESLTEERLDELLQCFLSDLKGNKLEENGWPTTPSAYKVSKAAMNAYTKILAKKNPTFCINCVCPGFVKTDINWNTGTLTVEEGAKGPVMLALLPDGSPSGLFYKQTEVQSFD